MAARVRQSPAGAVTSIRDAVADFVDGRLNWLNGLPTNAVTDLLSGALLLMRRDMEASVALASNVAANQALVVSTLADSGAGSLRQAILEANAAAGADTITFSVAGAIRVGATALPSITGTTVIDGTTAPGYDGKPVVGIDFQNTAGLRLVDNADNSHIKALSLVDSRTAGLTIAVSDTVIDGNYIGLWGDGGRVEANRGDGIIIEAGADGNLIGNINSDTFILSNVISGNRGNGVTITGGTANVVSGNYIGTDDTGLQRVANGGNGIHLTAGAAGNLIGGTATGGNQPTPPNPVVIRPPQGNLISGNRGNGVLIDDGATENQLSGNFVGTDYTGIAALGNRQDGVAIVNADGNKLIGTAFDLAPFVYYNVLSGNGGNGLRITDSNETTVWANFFGIGANNRTPVANRGNGMLVNGDSLGVKAGGPIPLGNVMSGNRGYGIEIADTAGGVLMFNEFVGQAAFGRTVANNAGGIRITSSNPHYNAENQATPGTFEPTNPSNSNEIRTCLVGGNNGNGIEFLGKAHGAQVTATAVGTDATIAIKVPNTGNGIVVGGRSNTISIGGFEPSIQYLLSDGFGVHVGASYDWGILIKGKAHDISIVNTRVGLGAGIRNEFPLPNGSGGISVGPRASKITIGGPIGYPDPLSPFNVEIALNHGPGLALRSAEDVTVAGAGIAYNDGDGIYATGNLRGTTVQTSTISGNDGSGVRLRWARGITVGGSQVADVNDITNNSDWGILATGWSRGSALTGNTLTDNIPGEINTKFSSLPSPTPTFSQIFTSYVPFFVTGVRGAGGNNVVVTATGQKSDGEGLTAVLYVGPLGKSTVDAKPYFLTPQIDNYKDSATFYGPNTHRFNPRLIPRGEVQAVGSYKTAENNFDNGMIYLGPPDGGTSGIWTPLNVPSDGSNVVGGVSACEGRSPGCSVAGTIAHSTMGNLVVGNYDLTLDGRVEDPNTVNAFIYSTATKQFTLLGTNDDPFGALEQDNHTTIYGVWQIGGQNSSLYAMAGGTGAPGVDGGERGFVVTYDEKTGKFGEPSYHVAQDSGANTHFEGITRVLGGFALAGESLTSQGTAEFAAFVPARIPALPFLRNLDNIRYGSAVWAPLDIKGSDEVCPTTCEVTTANTIYRNKLMGVYVEQAPPKTYLATLRGRFGLLPWWYL